jgi:hypothetical protein
VLVVALALGGCAPQGAPDDPVGDPVGVVTRLLEDLEKGRPRAAWARITEADRQALLERAAELRRAEGQPEPPTPTSALRRFGLEVTAEPENATLASRPGRRVRVRVNAARGRSATFEVVEEAGGWRVALLASLREAPSP